MYTSPPGHDLGRVKAQLICNNDQLLRFWVADFGYPKGGRGANINPPPPKMLNTPMMVLFFVFIIRGTGGRASFILGWGGGGGRGSQTLSPETLRPFYSYTRNTQDPFGVWGSGFRGYYPKP